METLLQRLDRMERENLRLKMAGVVVLAVIAAVVLMGQATGSKVAKVVEAEEFALLDKNGVRRAVLGATAGRVALILTNKDGKGSAWLEVETDGTARLVLADKELNERVVLALFPDGSASVAFAETGRRVRAYLGVLESEARLSLVAANKKAGIHLAVKPNGSSSQMNLRDTSGTKRATILLDVEGPIFGLLDKAGKVIWSAP